MRHSVRFRSPALAAATLSIVVSLVLARPAAAQRLDRGSATGDGFLFGRPQIMFALRGGFARPSANSQVFNDASRFLTLDRSDFAGGSMAADIYVRVADRLDVQFGSGLAVRTLASESRDYIGTDDRPINQSTIFRRVPTSLGLRYFLTPPGRSLGRLAWIPARFAPYVAAGGGATYYSFKQDGEFVDYQTLDIFPAALESKGWTASAYGSGGFEISLSSRVGLLTEARYDYARAAMGSEFVGYDRIDLSGVSASAGLTFRF